MEVLNTTVGPTIAFVGPNGSGKSTLARRLADQLRADGRVVTSTREPGGSPGAEDIRRLILEGTADRWSSDVEILLFMAARLDHLKQTIWPALARGEVVITDRYLPDTYAYQAAKDETMVTKIDAVVEAFQIPSAQLTLLIDVPSEVSRERIRARTGAGPDRFEIMGDSFEVKVRAMFLHYAKQQSRNIIVVDGHRSADEVFAEVYQVVCRHFGW